MSNLSELSQILKVKWRDEALLRQALTHSSANKSAIRMPDYDRLEFLGDRVLGVVIADLLYRAFPDAQEGELSRRLAALVRRETCSQVALSLNLGQYMAVGANARPSQTRNNANVQADVMEALLGAIYLDQGFPAAHAVIARLWAEFIHTPPQALKDAKSALQEWAQKRGLPAPLYEIVTQKGPDHKPFFEVKVVIENLPACTGEGASRRVAEHEAAAKMLKLNLVEE